MNGTKTVAAVCDCDKKYNLSLPEITAKRVYSVAQSCLDVCLISIRLLQKFEIETLL